MYIMLIYAAGQRHRTWGQTPPLNNRQGQRPVRYMHMLSVFIYFFILSFLLHYVVLCIYIGKCKEVSNS